MDLEEAIRGRRSVRKFRPDPVPRDLLAELLEISLWAPSDMNQQCWHAVAFAGDRLCEMVRICAEAFPRIEPMLQQVFADKPHVIAQTRQYFHTLGGAPAAVAFYRRPSVEDDFTVVQSIAAVIHNFCLLAHSRGLGSCWMTGPVPLEPQINDLLGIRDEKRLVAVVVVGYPDMSPKAPPRKPDRLEFQGFES